MKVELIVLISVAGTIIGIVTGLITLNRNKEKDMKKDAVEAATKQAQEAEKSAQVNVKLNHIISGVDEMKLDLKTNERQMKELSDQLIRLDESNKSAHKRIDKIESKF